MAAEWALHPPRIVLSPNIEERAIEIAKTHRAILEPGSVVADDGVVLQAWLIHPVSGNGDAVILLCFSFMDSRTTTSPRGIPK